MLVASLPHLDPNRFEVEVAYVLPWKDALVPTVERLGVPVHCLGGGRAFDLRWVRRLHRLVRTGEFDIVHAHLPYTALGARAVARRSTLVYTEHNLWSRYRTPTRWANAATFGVNDAVIAVSDAVAASIQHTWRPSFLGLPPVETLHHGIDPASTRRGPTARTEARRRLGLAIDELVVGSVGNFTAKKDHANLLAAFAALDAGPRLVLIGSGPLEESLRETVREMGLQDRVLFTGMRDDVAELLPGLDVFAMSSRFEGLPIALVEAMATGLPVIATAVGGVPEVLTHGRSGFLVAPGDPEALCVAMQKLLGDPDLRETLGTAAMVDAAPFSILPAVERLQSIYDEARR